MDQRQPPPFTVDIDEETSRGVYTNLGVLTFRDTEFVFDFIFIQPSPDKPKARVVSRVVTSPMHAKRLLSALSDNVRKYEEAFGEIRDPNPPTFGPIGPMS